MTDFTTNINVNLKVDLADLLAFAAHHDFLCDECNGCDGCPEDEDEDHTPRTQTEILEELQDLEALIWYKGDYQKLLKEVLTGGMAVVEHVYTDGRINSKVMSRDTWLGIQDAARKIESELGFELRDSELGEAHDLRVLKGRVEALRWVLGKDWPEAE
jgi:hypothetical protein